MYLQYIQIVFCISNATVECRIYYYNTLCVVWLYYLLTSEWMHLQVTINTLSVETYVAYKQVLTVCTLIVSVTETLD